MKTDQVLKEKLTFILQINTYSASQAVALLYFDTMENVNVNSGLKFGPRLSLVLPSWTSFEN